MRQRWRLTLNWLAVSAVSRMIGLPKVWLDTRRLSFKEDLFSRKQGMMRSWCAKASLIWSGISASCFALPRTRLARAIERHRASTGISSSDFVGHWVDQRQTDNKVGSGNAVEVLQRTFLANNGTLVSDDAAKYLAEQIGGRANQLSGYHFGGTTARRHCAQILQYLGFCRMTRVTGKRCLSGLLTNFARPDSHVALCLMRCSCRSQYLWSFDQELERLVCSQRQQSLDVGFMR